MSLLLINNLDIQLSGKPFLEGINLDIKKGTAYQIVGENGSGKSTLLSEIANQANMIEYGYLPQVAHQYPKVNFLLQDISDKEFSFYKKNLFKKSWHKSSGGERKKALIAKTLIEGKELILMDEPFNHLDNDSCNQIISCLEELLSKGISVIYTAHENKIISSEIIKVDQWRS